MRASKINLQFFRNHKGLSLDFPENQNICVLRGQNGAGKTSVLEAIYYAGFTKSFRSNHSEDMIFWDNDYFRIELDLNGENKEKYEIFYGKYPYNKRIFKINEIEKQSIDFIGRVKTVLFTPRDILMLTDQPSLRRAYINRLLLQTNNKFLNLFLKYQKALKQRNSILKNTKNINQNELAIWDEELAKYGSEIIRYRVGVIEFLATAIQKHYKDISGKDQSISLEYSTNASDEYLEFLENIKKMYEKDKRYQITNTGPHRDDISFEIDEKLLKSSASQGELRSVLLALKLAEAEYIEEKTQESPILLFDDVFSELDPNRQESLIKYLKKYQVLITAAEEHCITAHKDDVHIISM